MPGQENNRFRAFKNKGKDMAEMRRRRQDSSLELRKIKKDEQMFKKRNVNIEELDKPLSPLQDSKQQPTVSMTIPEIVQAIHSNNYAKQKEAVHAARKLLSREKKPPIGEVIKHKLVPKLVGFLSHNDDPEMQFEAAWALTNVASGTKEQTQEVVNEGAVPAFVLLLCNTSERVKEQAVWALGNIAGDGPELRDTVIRAGILKPLLALITPDIQTSFLRNVTWTLSNLCRNKNPAPPENVVKDVLPYLKKLINCCDKEVVADACWALSYLTDGSNDRIQHVVDADVINRVVNLLQSQELQIITPALRTIGNIVTGTDEQTQVVVDTGVLHHFAALLNHSKPNIQKEACWALSNITAGPPHQIAKVIEAELLPPLINVLAKGDFKAKKEACWAVSNMTTSGSMEQIVIAVQKGCLPPLCDVLDSHDSKIIQVALEAISNILDAGKKMEQLQILTDMLENIDAVKKIEDLQNHDNEDIYNAAFRLIDIYFSDEDEDISEMQPMADESGNYIMTAAEPQGGIAF